MPEDLGDAVQEALWAVLPHPTTRGRTFVELYYTRLQGSAKKGRDALIACLQRIVAAVNANSK